MGQRRERKQMAALVARRQRRGLTWAELSVESGVPKSTLHWWDRKLRHEGGPAEKPRFVQLAVVEPAPPAAAMPLEVVLRSGHRVWVAAGFDAEHLRRVILVLESGC